MIETSITVPIKGMFTVDWNLHNSINKGNIGTDDWNLHNSNNKGNVNWWLKPP